MATTTVSAQLIQYKDADNQVIVNIKTIAGAVSLVRSDSSKYSADVTTVQQLADALGSMAFSNGISNATSSAAGLMSAADKAKLDGVAAGANKYTHPNSGVKAGTYRSVTVNAQGHVTAGTNPTTLSGYGITDAASKTHSHGNADLTGLDASKLTGTIDIARLPQGALERMVTVADATARLALTTADVQKGDTVKQADTGLMYYVVDDTKLNSEDGYAIYTAGAATSVPWSGVTGKPSTFTPSSHTQAISTINGLQDALNGKAANKNMTGASADANGAAGLVPAPTKGAANRYLRSDGTWVIPPNTTYSQATTSTLGLVKLYTATGTAVDGTMTQKAITDALNGKSGTGHTHNYAGSSSAGGAANSVANSIAIKLNGGTTEGTNLFTFNGSAAKSINITPAAIGAAASSHGTHVSYSTNAPKANGTAAAGSSASVARADHVHPLQTTVSGNAGSATKWATARKINGLTVDGTADRSNYGSCSTAAATAAKVVDCAGFALVTGAEITVKFTVTNTAANPTLNVNGSGAKSIYYRGSAISAGYLAANRTYTFRYNGTQYDLVGDLDTNTVYTHPTSAGNKHIPSGGAAGQFLGYSASGTAAWKELFVIGNTTPAEACMWLKTE